MSITLNQTLADKYANSYVDVAYCDDFWLNHYSATKALAWAGLSSAQKTSLLIKACRVIETARFTVFSRVKDWRPLYYDRRTHIVAQLNDNILPVKYFYYQSLQFPRNLDRDIDSGALYIPEPVMLAQCEQTVYSLNFDDTALSNRMQGVVQDQTSVGSIHLFQTYTADGSEFCPQALEYVKPFLLKSSYEVRRG